MALTLTKRLTKGSALSAVEHDANLSAIESEVNAKATTSTVGSLTTTVNGKASQSSVDALSSTVDGKADQTDLDALELVVDGKVDDDDDRLTDRRAPADGDFGAFVVSEGEAILTNEAVTDVFDGMTDAAQRTFLIDHQGFARAEGATFSAGRPVIAGETAHELDYAPADDLDEATLDEFLTGTGNLIVTAAVARHMSLPSVLSDTPETISATDVNVIDWSGDREDDGDASDCHSLIVTFEPTTTRAVCVDTIHAGLVHYVAKIVITNPTSGAKTVTFVNHPDAGADVDLNGHTIPATGATAGDQVIIYATIVSTTEVRVERVQAA